MSSANPSSSIGRSRSGSAGATSKIPPMIDAIAGRHPFETILIHRRVFGNRTGTGRMFRPRQFGMQPRIILVGRNTGGAESLAKELRADWKVEVMVLTADLSLPETPGRIFSELSAQNNFRGCAGQQRRLWRERFVCRIVFAATIGNAPGQHRRADGTHRTVSARHDPAKARRDSQRRFGRRLRARPRHGGVLRDQGVRAVVHRGAGRGTCGHRIGGFRLCPGPTESNFGSVARGKKVRQ